MIANDLDDAAAMKSRAEEAGTAYEKALAEAKGRARALAQEPAPSSRPRATKSARRSRPILNQRLADAEATITSKKAEAMGHVHGIARDTASAIIERLTGKAPAAQKVEAALKQIKA